jgi:hypothetical protein
MRLFPAATFGLVLFGVSSSVGIAEEKIDVEGALAAKVIDPQLPLREVQEFTESRVLPMPEARSVAEWEKHAARMRQAVFDRVVFRGEAAQWRKIATKVESMGVIDGGDGYRIRKLRYEAVPGMWIPVLLYEPTNLKGKVPVVLNVNGHDRTNGKAAKYKQIRCINQAKRGMLALNVEWVGMGQLNTPDFVHYRMNQLDLCGTSGLSPFYLSMSRGIDVLLSHEHADPNRVAVAGLSGGGWQTIFISALDTRVTLSNPVAGYSSFKTRARNFSDLGDSEQTPVDLGATADYAQLTAMRAPRPTLLTFNVKDNCCFASGHALPPLLNAAAPIFKLYGKRGNLRSHVNFDPGTHNYEKDNRQQLYRMLGDHFFPNDASYDAREIDCTAELKTKAELNVDLPKVNAGFHTLAMRLGRSLPRDAGLPDSPDLAGKWQNDLRSLLASIVKWKRSSVTADKPREQLNESSIVRYRTLRIGNSWTVPSVEISLPVAGKAGPVAILLADAGRASAAKQANELLASGKRVLAIDPFYLGESRITQRAFLFALMVSTVGQRPLGIQADQVAAVARWAKKDLGGGAVEVVAVGPRTSLAALVAGALEPDAIGSVTLHESLGSLQEVLEKDLAVNTHPEYFCFGLLERFDVKQLTALVAPRRVRFVAPSARVKKELADLKGWYKQMGVDADPLK